MTTLSPGEQLLYSMQRATALALEWLEHGKRHSYAASLIEDVVAVLHAGQAGTFTPLDDAVARAMAEWGGKWRVGVDAHTAGMIPEEIRRADPAHPADCPACKELDTAQEGREGTDGPVQ